MWLTLVQCAEVRVVWTLAQCQREKLMLNPGSMPGGECQTDRGVWSPIQCQKENGVGSPFQCQNARGTNWCVVWSNARGPMPEGECQRESGVWSLMIWIQLFLLICTAKLAMKNTWKGLSNISINGLLFYDSIKTQFLQLMLYIMG